MQLSSLCTLSGSKYVRDWGKAEALEQSEIEQAELKLTTSSTLPAELFKGPGPAGSPTHLLPTPTRNCSVAWIVGIFFSLYRTIYTKLPLNRAL